MRERGEIICLSDLINITHGYAFKSDFFCSSGQYVLLTPGNFREGGGFIDLGSKQKYYDGPIPNGFVLKPGDLLVAMTEQAPGLIGSTMQVPEGAIYLHNQRLGKVVINKPDKIEREYLLRSLNAEHIHKQISIASAGTKVRHTSPDKIRSVSIWLPPLSEQRQIAAILQTWDEAIEKLEALRKIKQRRFAGVAQILLAPSRAVGRHIPRSNWTLMTFGEVFEERRDRNECLGSDDVVTVGKYAIRKQTEHFLRSVASSDLSNYWVISPGDFVYDPMSAYYGALGRYDGSQDGIVSPAYRVIRLAPDVHSDFIVHLLRSHHIRFLLETRSSQGNREGKRRLLQREEFAGIEFNLPPMKLQMEIARKLADFRHDLSATERQLEALTRQKRGLMQKLLTGEWRISLGPAEAAAE